MFVKGGTLYAGSGWVLTVVDPATFVIGTDAIIPVEFFGPASGDVRGPASATDDAVALFDGTTGKLIKDGIPYATANTASTIVARDASGDFSAGTITASLSGNASTATSATSATNATNADNINISATTSTDTTTYPVLVGGASTGNQTPFVDTGLVYNADTNALTATTFVGALSGNATTSSSTSGTSTTSHLIHLMTIKPLCSPKMVKSFRSSRATTSFSSF